MIRKRKEIWVLMLTIALFLISVSYVQAFGVTAPYWKENPLTMAPGETKEVTFTLQNMVGDEDMQATVDLISDKRYVELLGETEYDVPAKTKDIPVTVKISIPQEISIGTSFPLRIAFRSAAKGTTQQIQLGTGIEKTFDVFVGQGQAVQEVEAPVTPKKEYALLKKPATPALIVIIVVFLIWLLLRKSRKKRSEVNTDGQNARW